MDRLAPRLRGRSCRCLILYIPATISFVLTNMRYTTTVQPLFMFWRHDRGSR